MSNVRPHANAETVVNATVTHRPEWRRIALAVVLWLVGCLLAGVFLALVNSGHGSILFVILGLAVGISGAVSHTFLLLVPRFRELHQALQVLFVWAGSVALLFLFAAYSSIQNERPYASALVEAVGILLMYCAPAALVAAAVVSRAVKNAA